MSGKKDKMYAYRESSDVIESYADITFLGKIQRLSARLGKGPEGEIEKRGNETIQQRLFECYSNAHGIQKARGPGPLSSIYYTRLVTSGMKIG